MLSRVIQWGTLKRADPIFGKKNCRFLPASYLKRQRASTLCLKRQSLTFRTFTTTRNNKNFKAVKRIDERSKLRSCASLKSLGWDLQLYSPADTVASKPGQKRTADAVLLWVGNAHASIWRTAAEQAGDFGALDQERKGHAFWFGSRADSKAIGLTFEVFCYRLLCIFRKFCCLLIKLKFLKYAVYPLH